MDDVLKHEFGLSKRAKIGTIIGLFLVFVVSISIYLGIHVTVKYIGNRQAKDSLANITQLNQSSVSSAIECRRMLLEVLSSRVTERGITDIQMILDEMDAFLETYDFYRMGVMDEDIMLYLTNGRIIDGSQEPQIVAAWREDFYISESFIALDGGKYAVNMLSYPVYYDGQLKYVLFATYYSKGLTEGMNISSVGASGYTFLLSKDGRVVIYPKTYENEGYNSLMKYINDSGAVVPNNSGEGYFYYEGDKYYARFERLDINDWYLMTCSKESDVFAGATMVLRVAALGMGLLWLMIIVAMIATFVSMFASKKELRRYVFYDSMLGIGNGNYLSVYYRSLSKKDVADMYLIVFDIDKFKEFNYIYGEEEGDKLLKYIVKTVDEEIPKTRVFRTQSDHFVAIIKSNPQDLLEKAGRLEKRFDWDIKKGIVQPFDISAGIRKINKGETLGRIISDALIAKGTIKGIQVKHYAFYDENILFRRVKFMEMESDFKRALQDDEFKVYYQPKYDIRTGKIIGAEALVRWIKGDGTIVPPIEFIPCYEVSRQVLMLDERMLYNVCRQMKEMKAEGLPIRTVSINLSRVHLRTPDILGKIEGMFKEFDIDPDMISFEITETAIFEDSDLLKSMVKELHNLGCKVQVDDYGIGASGLNALANNFFDVIKLDKSFVDGIGNPRIEEVIRSSISLADRLGIEFIAEGVEEEHQARKLLEWGCSLAQGYYYSPPVPETEYKRLLMGD